MVSTAHALPTTRTLIELTECSKCGLFFDQDRADYDTGDLYPVCDSCVNADYAGYEPDQDYMVFEHGVALF